MNEIAALATLFATAFGAATFLPIQSEIILGALAFSKDYNLWLLLLVATTGNVLGALLNWWLGTQIERFSDRQWFPIKQASIDKVSGYYLKWGKWSLLLAWTPFLGDPLTLVAGIFRTPLKWFIPLVTIGKAARYAALLAII